MFYYPGRKKRVAGKYPDPEFPTIVEPFAGSAAYALHGDRWKLRVIINDLNPDVVGVWRYLQQATERDIKALPDLKPGDKLSDIASLSEVERWLLAFHINPGAKRRSDKVTKANRWSAGRRYIEANLHKIKHWEIRCEDYRQLDDIGDATWFVDPPSQETAVTDYVPLAEWSLSRPGQLIVCERSGASWLPFVPLGKEPQEVVFVRDDPPVEECPGCGAAMRASGPAAWRCSCGSRVRYLSIEEAENMETYYPECIVSGAQDYSGCIVRLAQRLLQEAQADKIRKGRSSCEQDSLPGGQVTP